MSKENAIAFFKKLEEDEDFRDEFIKDPSLEKGRPETILKAAEDRGFAFTEAELEAAREEAKDAELSDEDLEKVAGGLLIATCVVVGAAVTEGYSDKLRDATDGFSLKGKNKFTLALCLMVGLN